ncbi:MAG: tetratricopeptide repeat protein [Alphaproteobacteria bacterium]|nr:tetratricopeptide repeat protein [Alphaproteobacteria bacterium]
MFGLLGYLTSPIGLIALGLLVLCVVHSVRTGNVFPWIYVMVFLPGIGPLIYFFFVIVPELLHGRRAQTFRRGAARAIDPNKDYRAAMREVEMVGSVDAKRALAEQLLQRGQYGDAIELYRNALQGQFATDPALLVGLARAQMLNGDGAGAQASLDALQKADPSFSSQDAHMIYARALELQGKDEEAVGEYQRLVPYFAGEEARTRLGQALDRLGRRDEARAAYAQVLKNLDGAPQRYRKAQREWGDIASRAMRA